MKMLLDSQWKFYRGDPGVPPYGGTYSEAKVAHPVGPANPDALDTTWRDVTVPHDWSIEENVQKWGRPSQGFFSGGTGWYRTQFNLPPESENKKVFLVFEGVSRCATVWVNGFLLGTHTSGYTANTLDITDFVPRSLMREGESVVSDFSIPEVIAVHVDCSETEGWWYEGCGIYRPVWVHIVDKLHFVPDGIHQRVKIDTTAKADVTIEAETINGYPDPVNCTIQSTILDINNIQITSHKTQITIPSGQTLKPTVFLHIDKPHLWSPESPYLYIVRTEILHNTTVVETYEHVCGIRWCHFDPQKGFFLNGKPYKIHGVNCHQDFAGVGVALPDRLHKKKIELLKEMGCNAYRCSHHPCSSVLDACDRLGMLVMAENRMLDSSPNGSADLISMVRHDRNHPSIFIWSLFNEEYLSTRKLGAKSVRTLVKIVREHDPDRVCTAAIVFGKSHTIVEEFWRPLDVVGRNYHPDCYLDDHEKYPDQIMLATEFCTAASARGVYRPSNGYPSWYNIDTPTNNPSPYEETWKPIAQNEFMAGGFIWAGIDYRGEPTPVQWPNTISQFGIMDICGFPKDGYFYYRSWWKAHEPLVYIFPHWNWPGKEGQIIVVRCFSNCDTIELFLNGLSMGKKTMPQFGDVSWSVPYKPGTLQCVGYIDGKQSATMEVTTSGQAAMITLDTDRKELCADGKDIACISISIVDKNGIPVPDANNELHFSVNGSGRLLGSGNGDPQCLVPDKSDYRPAFNGKCLVIIQADKHPGTLVVTVCSPGLPDATITIVV